MFENQKQNILLYAKAYFDSFRADFITETDGDVNRIYANNFVFSPDSEPITFDVYTFETDIGMYLSLSSIVCDCTKDDFVQLSVLANKYKNFSAFNVDLITDSKDPNCLYLYVASRSLVVSDEQAEINTVKFFNHLSGFAHLANNIKSDAKKLLAGELDVNQLL